MSDLRAAMEGLRDAEDNVARETGHPFASLGYVRACNDILRLIPEGAVLVTEETLAAALDEHIDSEEGYCGSGCAADILRHLREGT